MQRWIGRNRVVLLVARISEAWRPTTVLALSKGLGKQLVVAVHERALFDYLSLELSPAFAGDSLITVEISRSFDGNTVADPKYIEFVEDNAVAA